LPQGPFAGLLAIPWALFTGSTAFLVGIRCLDQRSWSLPQICNGVAFVYLTIGAGWAVLDRLGVRPLDFEPVIVLLTAIHFHYAGFVLPLLVAGVASVHPGVFGKAACVAVTLGVPLVAIGITATQLGLPKWIETCAALCLAAAGCASAVLLCRHALTARVHLARLCWMVSGLSLAASMILAGLYASRFLVSMDWLDIPLMRATHGTANAFGFGLLGVIARAIEDHDQRPAGTRGESNCPSASANPSSTSTSCT
jgi:hypothetical protein